MYLSIYIILYLSHEHSSTLDFDVQFAQDAYKALQDKDEEVICIEKKKKLFRYRAF